VDAASCDAKSENPANHDEPQPTTQTSHMRNHPFCQQPFGGRALCLLIPDNRVFFVGLCFFRSEPPVLMGSVLRLVGSRPLNHCGKPDEKHKPKAPPKNWHRRSAYFTLQDASFRRLLARLSVCAAVLHCSTEAWLNRDRYLIVAAFRGISATNKRSTVRKAQK
jgi:hypothetical protein